jgi:hypothetical protein
MLRSLSDHSLQALVATPFWQGIRSDVELFPEIRNDAITVYYRGAALIRNLRLKDGVFIGATHRKYIPIGPAATTNVEFTSTGEGLCFTTPVGAWPLGDANADVLQAYKMRMQTIGGPENKVIHALCCRSGNVIVDQELKFQTAGSGTADKIDILSFDPTSSTYSFVEVKGITDRRLREGANGLREVADQLRLYGERIQAHADSIRSAIDHIIELKSRLGLGERVALCQGNPAKRLLAKPILVIGGCREQEVQDILLKRNGWESMLECLEPVAAGLILCGNAGTRLDLAEGTQRRWFDRECVK